MNRLERQLTKQFATQQIQNLNVLVEVINNANTLQIANEQLEKLADKLSEDLQAAQARIGEDEATISIKDEQLKNAEERISKLVEQVNGLIEDKTYLLEQNKRQTESIQTFEELHNERQKNYVTLADDKGNKEYEAYIQNGQSLEIRQKLTVLSTSNLSLGPRKM